MVKRIIYPPIWLLFGLIAIFACNEYFPGPRFTSLTWQIVGGAVIVIGLVLLVTANGLFTRAGTGVIPFRIIEVRFIRPEENMLRGMFPQDYPAYCERVRRWL